MATKSPLEVLEGYYAGYDAQLTRKIDALRTAAAEIPQDTHHVEELAKEVTRIQGCMQGLNLAIQELRAVRES